MLAQWPSTLLIVVLCSLSQAARGRKARPAPNTAAPRHHPPTSAQLNRHVSSSAAQAQLRPNAQEYGYF